MPTFNLAEKWENQPSPDTSRECMEHCEDGMKKVLGLFVRKLAEGGVPPADIKNALSEVNPYARHVAREMVDYLVEKEGELKEYGARKAIDEKRRDYMGRAILHEIEKYFPGRQNVSDVIKSTEVKGMLPHQVAGGIISAVTKAHGADALKRYGRFFAKMAERHRSRKDNLVDVDAFLNDPEVKETAGEIIGKFRKVASSLEKDTCRKWLMKVISGAASFGEMKRDLSPYECDLIEQALMESAI